MGNPTSFVRVLQTFIRARQASGIALGKADSVLSSPDQVSAVLYRCPDGELFLSCINWGQCAIDFTLYVPCDGGTAVDVVAGETVGSVGRDGSLILTLDWWQAVALKIRPEVDLPT